MMKYIMMAFFLLSWGTASVQAQVCVEPKTLEASVQEFEKVLAGQTIPAGDPSNAFKKFYDYAPFIFLRTRYVELYFPPVHKTLFQDYLSALADLDLMLEHGDPPNADDLRALRNRHFYILGELIPVVLDPVLFASYNTQNPDPELQDLADDLKGQIQEELRIVNLKNCQAERVVADRKLVDLITPLEDQSEYELKSLAPDPYNFEFQYFADPFDERAVVDLKELGVDDASKSAWYKKLFNTLKGVLGNHNYQAEINQSSNSVNLEYLEAQGTYKTALQQHLAWEQDRNYKLYQARNLSGFNQDLKEERFGWMLDRIVATLASFDRLLASMEHICNHQDRLTKCWGN